MLKKIIEFADKVTEISLYLLIFCLPISISLVEIFSVIAIIAWLTTKILLCFKEKQIDVICPVNSGINKWLYLFLLLCLVSSLFSVDVYKSMEKLIGVYFQNILLFFVLAEVFQSKRKIKNSLIALFASVVLLFADSLFQKYVGFDFLRGIKYYENSKIQGSFCNPNDFAAWIISMIPIVLGVLNFFKSKVIVKNKSKKILLNLGVIFIVLILLSLVILTFTRGAWVAFILALGIMFCLSRNKLTVGIIFLIFIAVCFGGPKIVKDRMSTLSFMRISQTTGERIDLWKQTIEIIEEFPVVGIGLGNYMNVSGKFKVKGQYAHNSYLQLMAEVGIPCFIVFMLMLLVFYINNLKVFFKYRNKDELCWVLLGFLIGLSAFLMHSAVDTFFFSVQLNMLMWYLMGCSVAVSRIIERDNV